jgi:hypothetical protein
VALPSPQEIIIPSRESIFSAILVCGKEDFLFRRGRQISDFRLHVKAQLPENPFFKP